jgi:hypothetical protein
MTFADWIDEKTPKTLHDVFGYRDGTIRMWKTRNIIPRGVWPEIMSEGMATLKELIAMEKAANQ